MRETWLWEHGSTYQYDYDTCAVMNDSTSLGDSLMLYDYWGITATGEGIGVIFCMDSLSLTDSTYAVFPDSITITAAPRVRAKAGSRDTDRRELETVWTEELTLQTISGILCSNWAPTADRTYLLTHPTWWQEICVDGIVIKIKKASGNDSCFVKSCRTRYIVN